MHLLYHLLCMFYCQTKLHVISLNLWTFITFPHSMKFIEELMDEHIETRDSILTDGNDNYWVVNQEPRVIFCTV